MEVAHLDRTRESLQQATSAITDDRLHLPSDHLQEFNSFFVCRDCFVREELPQEVLFVVNIPPDHDPEEAMKVRGVHDDDHLIGSDFLLPNLDIL